MFIVTKLLSLDYVTMQAVKRLYVNIHHRWVTTSLTWNVRNFLTSKIHQPLSVKSIFSSYGSILTIAILTFRIGKLNIHPNRKKSILCTFLSTCVTSELIWYWICRRHLSNKRKIIYTFHFEMILLYTF